MQGRSVAGAESRSGDGHCGESGGGFQGVTLSMEAIFYRCFLQVGSSVVHTFLLPAGGMKFPLSALSGGNGSVLRRETRVCKSRRLLWVARELVQRLLWQQGGVRRRKTRICKSR